MPNIPRFFDPSPLWPYLAEGWRIVTPNSRLASRVRLSIVDQAYAETLKPVESPAILSLKNWFDDLWQQYLEDGDSYALAHRILTDDQELMLWQQIIADSTEALLNPQAIARDLMQARRWLWQWQIDLDDSRIRIFFISREHQAALNWFAVFDQYCAKSRWLTREARNSYISQTLPEKKKYADEKILLLGFAELSPRDRAVMAAISQCETLPDPEFSSRRELLAFNDSNEELLAAANWIKQRLEQSEDRIALVVPDLTARRAAIVRVVQQVLQPEQFHMDSEWKIPPFNISAGESLGELPIARIAVLALRLAYTHLQRNEWQTLFASPYFSILSEERKFLAQLLVQLAETRSDVLEASALRKAIQYASEKFSPDHKLAEILLSVANQQRQSSGKYSSSVWAEKFRHLLHELNWPGQRGLQSIDYQQHQQIQDALDGFASADFLLKALSAAEAIRYFESLLQRQIFQPQSVDSRVQILGTLEAAGLQFDAMWILGMDEMHWPPSPSPNPFLPLRLQNDYQLPRSSAQRELALAITLTRQLLGSSYQIIASYCQLQDETHYGPSALLENFVEKPFQSVNGSLLSPLILQSDVLKNVPVQIVDAGQAPPYRLQSNESSPPVIRGGSNIITDQAQCAFRSFVVHRLQGEALEPAGYVFDQREQGSLLHKALEEFWSDIPDQLALIALSEEELHQRCGQSIDKALQYMTQSILRRGVTFGPVLQSLEAVRLKNRMLSWLDEEKRRPPFAVYSREETVKLKLADLHITLRADRIDQLADGSFIVIDYKTGLADKPLQWLGDRPENLQLPLYVVQFSQQRKPVSGLAFAKIHPEKIVMEGLGRDEQTGLLARYQLGTSNNIEWQMDNWSDLLQHWQNTVHSLAEEFCRGEAKIFPLKPPKTCDYCELKPVCRFHLDQIIEDDEESVLEWRDVD
jgi:ATP-dependent helicase/nuclease subunit B